MVFGTNQYSVAGNFPYNISSQIVFRVLEKYGHVPELVGMFQYEMARRIVSGPGSKEYGIISVLTASRYFGRLLFSVPPGAFMPPPKVDSAVIHLRRHVDPELPCQFRSLQVVVKTAFGQRRKMLRNSLAPLFPSGTLDEAFFQQRPEQLSLAEFIDIAVRFEKISHR